MIKNIYIVYKHTSPSGKSYIGQTKHMEQRTKEHQSKHSECRAFKGAIQKYGFENFTTEVLAENLTIDEANVLEEKFISDYNTIVPNGYNLKTGGANQIPSEESIELMSKAKRGELNSNYGKTGAMTGRKHTPEASLKISIKKSKENHHMWGKVGTMTGKKHTEEALAKMRIPKTEEHKRKLAESRKGINKGRTVSPESIAKRLATLAAKKAAKLTNLETEVPLM